MDDKFVKSTEQVFKEHFELLGQLDDVNECEGCHNLRAECVRIHDLGVTLVITYGLIGVLFGIVGTLIALSLTR